MLFTFRSSLMASLILSGGIFGFFLAWICSTMWGLDNADPRVAIAAMQAMNASVRNATFAPFFFGPTPVLLLTSSLAFISRKKTTGALLLVAAIIYLLGGNMLTFTVNVQMNEELAHIAIPETIEEANAIWQAYSPKWQIYNQIRTVFSGLSLLLVGLAIMTTNRV